MQLLFRFSSAEKARSVWEVCLAGRALSLPRAAPHRQLPPPWSQGWWDQEGLRSACDLFHPENWWEWEGEERWSAGTTLFPAKTTITPPHSYNNFFGICVAVVKRLFRHFSFRRFLYFLNKSENLHFSQLWKMSFDFFLGLTKRCSILG
jgi:hypothetical protein